MTRNRKAKAGAGDTGLHISYGGGRDSTAVSMALVEGYAPRRYAAGPSRGEGVKILRNPDFVEGLNGWTDLHAAAEISRLSDLSVERLFRAWGPGFYPRLKYDTPAAVQRGFARHLAMTGDRPLPPEPFVLDSARYRSTTGLTLDMRGMLADAEAAERAGRTVYHPVETVPGAAEERRLATGRRGRST